MGELGLFARVTSRRLRTANSNQPLDDVIRFKISLLQVHDGQRVDISACRHIFWDKHRRAVSVIEVLPRSMPRSRYRRLMWPLKSPCPHEIDSPFVELIPTIIVSSRAADCAQTFVGCISSRPSRWPMPRADCISGRSWSWTRRCVA